MPAKRVQVLFSDAELGQVKRDAGLIALSAYLRNLALGKPEVPKHAAKAAVVAPERIPGVSRGVPERKLKTCEHGMEKGWNCWRCGGLAKVE